MRSMFAAFILTLVACGIEHPLMPVNDEAVIRLNSNIPADRPDILRSGMKIVSLGKGKPIDLVVFQDTFVAAWQQEGSMMLQTFSKYGRPLGRAISLPNSNDYSDWNRLVAGDKSIMATSFSRTEKSYSFWLHEIADGRVIGSNKSAGGRIGFVDGKFASLFATDTSPESVEYRFSDIVSGPTLKAAMLYEMKGRSRASAKGLLAGAPGTYVFPNTYLDNATDTSVLGITYAGKSSSFEVEIDRVPGDEGPFSPFYVKKFFTRGEYKYAMLYELDSKTIVAYLNDLVVESKQEVPFSYDVAMMGDKLIAAQVAGGCNGVPRHYRVAYYSKAGEELGVVKVQDLTDSWLPKMKIEAIGSCGAVLYMDTITSESKLGFFCDNHPN